MNNSENESPDEKKKDSSKTALQKNLQAFNVDIAEEDFEAAKNEWQNIHQFVPGLPVIVRTKSVTYDELLTFLKCQDMTPHLTAIRPIVRRRRGLKLLCRWIVGPPKLKPCLLDERNMVFALAQYPFSTTNDVHMQVLQTLYKTLTGKTVDCPQFGSHWEEIGFQGCNPATDLRGAGFLALLHLIYLITNFKLSSTAKDIYKLSHHELQHFPFSVMSINMTRITLEALREECLNRLCNERNCVIPVVSEFYCGTFLMLYRIWRKDRKTIMDSGYVIQDVTKLSKKNPAAVIESVTRINSEETETDLVQFSDIGDINISVPITP